MSHIMEVLTCLLFFEGKKKNQISNSLCLNQSWGTPYNNQWARIKPNLTFREQGYILPNNIN